MISLEEKYRADQIASHATARLDGIEIGLMESGMEGRMEGHMKDRMEGRMKGRMEVARNLKAVGAEKALIMKVSGLTEQEVDAL